MPHTRKFVIADVALAVVMILMAGAVFVHSFTLPEPALEPVGPAAFPFAVSILLMALSGQVLWRAFTGQPANDRPAPHRKRYDLAALTLGLTVAYLASLQWELATFRQATMVYAFVLTAALFRWRPRRLPIAVIIALVLGVGLKFVFTQVLYLDLP